MSEHDVVIRDYIPDRPAHGKALAVPGFKFWDWSHAAPYAYTDAQWKRFVSVCQQSGIVMEAISTADGQIIYAIRHDCLSEKDAIAYYVPLSPTDILVNA